VIFVIFVARKILPIRCYADCFTRCHSSSI
jgi:hypothetical protein